VRFAPKINQVEHSVRVRHGLWLNAAVRYTDDCNSGAGNGRGDCNTRTQELNEQPSQNHVLIVTRSARVRKSQFRGSSVSNLEEAILLAVKAHHGQRDKAGA